jgi:hypothetical protein
MPGYPPDRINGPRLTLRPPAIDDAGALFQRVGRGPQVNESGLWPALAVVAGTLGVFTE